MRLSLARHATPSCSQPACNRTHWFQPAGKNVRHPSRKLPSGPTVTKYSGVGGPATLLALSGMTGTAAVVVAAVLAVPAAVAMLAGVRAPCTRTAAADAGGGETADALPLLAVASAGTVAFDAGSAAGAGARPGGGWCPTPSTCGSEFLRGFWTYSCAYEAGEGALPAAHGYQAWWSEGRRMVDW